MSVELDIRQVRTMITRNYEPRGMYILDMIFISEEPHVVFEWKQREDGQHIPVVYAPVEQQFLETMPAGSGFDFMYRLAVEDPRPDPEE